MVVSTGAVASAAVALLITCLWIALYVRLHRSRFRLRRRLDAATDELERLQAAFARFAPPLVVDRIAAEGHAAHAERREATVLFVDLVGFTALAEELDPGVLVDILNGYFARMSEAASRHRGHVSKFLGDGMLILFGALERNPWQVNDAAHAALAMRAALESYNAELAERGGPELRVGIGIHAGPVVAGVVGTRSLLEFTVIGCVVNLAARVEHLTRVHDTDILVTNAVRDRLDPRFRLRELPASPVRGLDRPVVTHVVDGYD